MARLDKIRILQVCPNEVPKVVNITNSLRTMQKLVNGKIEITYLLNDEEVCIICNDEGKLNGSLPNRIVGQDIIYDNFLVVGDDIANGDFKSLTIQQIKKYRQIFNEESITRTKSQINARNLVKALFGRRG